MIKEIRYKNFKALRDATLPLGRFTLIVGANGTGKTSAIKALEIAKNYKKHIWKDLVSVDSLLLKDNLVSIEVNRDQTTREIQWKENADKGEEVGSIYEFNDKLKDSFHKTKTEIFNNFRIYTFDSNRIAESVSVVPNSEVDENGRGLAGVLLSLKISEHEIFEKLNCELQNWFPEFDRLDFEIPESGKVSFLLRTKIGKHKIKAEDLSDGTRLSLAYLTIAYLPNPPKIVAFEEPEKGIHPRLLENIQEAMYRLAYPENYGEKREPIQVIATTHSPYLLDLYKDYPEEIVIASKDENGVHFERLIDKPHFEEVIQDAPLGEVWYTGVLGGVPVQP